MVVIDILGKDFILERGVLFASLTKLEAVLTDL